MNHDILCRRDGDIATVILFNPDKLNALNAMMWRRLREVMATLAADDSLRCVILRGEGAAFAAGGDLEEFRTRARHGRSGAGLPRGGGRRAGGHRVLPASDGGGDPRPLHRRRAGNRQRLRPAHCRRGCAFGAPIMKLGFSMYPGELAGLLKLAGPAVAKEILLEGRLLDAAEAYAKGLLTRVVADDEVLREAQATAERIAAGAPLVARWHKQWIARLMDGRPLTAEEKRASFAFLDTQDYAEGLAAFLEKRPPRFTGR